MSEELIIFKLRQLRCAEHHLVAHQQRWTDLCIAAYLHIAVLSDRAGMNIEKQLPERALHAREALLQYHEARAGEFCRQFEIHHAERFAQFEMLLGLKGIIALL